MPCRPPNVFQIIMFPAGPDALLAGSGPVVAPLVQAEEAILELDHSSIRKEKRGILPRNQGRARNNGMPPRGEVVKEGLSDLRSTQFSHH